MDKLCNIVDTNKSSDASQYIEYYIDTENQVNSENNIAQLEQILEDIGITIKQLLQQYIQSFDRHDTIKSTFEVLECEACCLYKKSTEQLKINQHLIYIYECRLIESNIKTQRAYIEAIDSGVYNKKQMTTSYMKELYTDCFRLISQEGYFMFDCRAVKTKERDKLIYSAMIMMATCITKYPNADACYYLVSKIMSGINQLQFSDVNFRDALVITLEEILYIDDNKDMRKASFHESLRQFMQILENQPLLDIAYIFVSIFSYISNSPDNRALCLPVESILYNKLAKLIAKSKSKLVRSEPTFFQRVFSTYESVLIDLLKSQVNIEGEDIIKSKSSNEMECLYKIISFGQLLVYYKTYFPEDYLDFTKMLGDDVLNTVFNFQAINQTKSNNLLLCIPGIDSQSTWSCLSSNNNKRCIVLNWNSLHKSFYFKLASNSQSGQKEIKQQFMDAYERAKIVGKCLALIIMHRFPFYNRTISIIAEGIGCNIAYNCIKTLYKLRFNNILCNTYFILWHKKSTQSCKEKLGRYLTCTSGKNIFGWSRQSWVSTCLSTLLNCTLLGNEMISNNTCTGTGEVISKEKDHKSIDITCTCRSECIDECLPRVLHSFDVI